MKALLVTSPSNVVMFLSERLFLLQCKYDAEHLAPHIENLASYMPVPYYSSWSSIKRFEVFHNVYTASNGYFSMESEDYYLKTYDLCHVVHQR